MSPATTRTIAIDAALKRRNASTAAAVAIDEKAKAESRELTAEEVADMARHLDDAEAADAEAQRACGYSPSEPTEPSGDVRARLDAASAAVKRPFAKTVAGLGGDGSLGESAPTDRPVLPFAAPRGSAPLRGRSYRDLVLASGGRITSGGFASFEDFLRTVHSGRLDPRLSAAHNEGVGSEGGFLVPTEYAARVLDVSLESEIVRPRAELHGMAAPTKMIAGFDTLDTSDGTTFGGFSGQWLAEQETATRKKAKFRAIELHARELALFTAASNQLIQDGMNFEAMLGDAMTKAVNWHLDRAFLVGDGVGKPLGVLKDPALIVVSKEGGQPAATLRYANIVKMYARLHPACVANAAWVTNPTTLPELLSLVLPVKNVAGTENVGGVGLPLLQPDGKGGYTMLGLPVLRTEKVPALGAQGDVLLADFSQYAVGFRPGITLERSNAPGWTESVIDYRTILRVDGLGKWSRAYKPLNGDTLSWCVTLEARA